MLKAVNSSPSFGQVSLVRVSKKAFRNPNDLKACEREFDIKLRKTNSGSKFGYYVNQMLRLVFPKSIKFVTNIEGLRLRAAKSFPEKDYHSFLIYTGEDKEKFLNLVSKKKTKQNSEIVNSEYTFNHYMAQFSNAKKYMTQADNALCYKKYLSEQVKRSFELLSKQAKETFRNSRIQEFRIESLEEIKGLNDKLDLK